MHFMAATIEGESTVVEQPKINFPEGIDKPTLKAKLEDIIGAIDRKKLAENLQLADPDKNDLLLEQLGIKVGLNTAMYFHILDYLRTADQKDGAKPKESPLTKSSSLPEETFSQKLRELSKILKTIILHNKTIVKEQLDEQLSETYEGLFREILELPYKAQAEVLFLALQTWEKPLAERLAIMDKIQIDALAVIEGLKNVRAHQEKIIDTAKDVKDQIVKAVRVR